MVATHSQPRRPSSGSMAHSSGRSRRRSSLRRQNEKLSTSILPPTAVTPSTSTAARGVNSHNGRRSRSVSAGSHRHSQLPNNRRPSAPAVVEMPRLSIADRFMSSNFNSSTPPPPLPQQPPRSTTPSTTSNSLVNSASYDMPTTGSSNSRLSVANRFMNNTSPTNSTLSLSGIQQYRERSASSFSGRATLNTRSSSIAAPTTSSDPVPGRLTIANAFMKSSSTLSPTIDTRSRVPSFGDLDLGVANGNIKDRYAKTSPVNTQQIHPLEEQQRTIFDDNNTQYLNLDLSISPSSASSSVLNNRSNSRPWGSQDTLVHHYSNQQSERKKPIYAQFIESEKNATIMSDNRSFSLGDYFLDSPDNHHDKRTMSDDLSTKHGYDDYDDIEIGGYDKHYAHERQWSYEEEEDEEEKSYQEHKSTSSPAVSTIKLKKHQDIEQQLPIDDYGNNTGGFWVGCCFVNCGQRPSRQTIEQRQKHRQEKETDGDIRRKNRGFGKRGWVFCVFLSLLVFILITVFLWPRTPLMRIEGASLTSPAKITETIQGVMVGNVAFESEWMVNITVDNRQNHVPTRLVQVQVLAKDALTGLVIGKGLHNDDPNPEHIILAPNTISTIQIPIHVDYQARDSTDTTFVDLTKACSPQQQLFPFNSPDGNTQSNGREALPLHFWITLHFFGLDWVGYKPTVIATPATGGFACPQS